MYSRETREWSSEDRDFIGVFADMATSYLVRVSEAAEARDLAEQLQRALDSRILIEQAKGRLAGVNNISADEAFEVLRRYARNHNIRLAKLCHGVMQESLQIPIK